MAQLLFYTDRELFDRVTLGRSAVTVGRGRRCSVQLRDERVSRTHVVIRPCRCDGDAEELAYELEDRSLNGTIVNGRQVEGVRRLYLGDWIEIEDFVILCRDDTEPVVRRLGTPPPRRNAR
jgi:pSer/pThr/pTyr-binding forkhead associated (FHA) protein